MLTVFPLQVKLSRLEKHPDRQGAFIQKESAIGFLVNSQGDFVESPAIGEPVILSNSDIDIRPDHETPPVNYIEIHEGKWLIQTDAGIYSLFHGRKLH